MIGSNLTNALLNLGHDVLAVDNLWRGRRENLRKCVGQSFDFSTSFAEMDLRNYDSCLQVTRDADMVVHLADIVAGIEYVYRNELFVFQNNLTINSNILSSALENNVSKFLYVGTACSYPQEKQSSLNPPPLREEDAFPANPESGYGWSKLMGEYECGLAEKEGRIATVVLRLHNVYGPGCDTSIDRSQVIPALCRKAIEYPDRQFVVWGSGTQKRAFIYVDDVVDAIILSMDKGIAKGVIQIGPTVSHSISDIAEHIIRISGKDIEMQFDPSRAEGDKDRMADNSKAYTVLGWSPTVEIQTGLLKTYQWVLDQIEM